VLDVLVLIISEASVFFSQIDTEIPTKILKTGLLGRWVRLGSFRFVQVQQNPNPKPNLGFGPVLGHRLNPYSGSGSVLNRTPAALSVLVCLAIHRCMSAPAYLLTFCLHPVFTVPLLGGRGPSRNARQTSYLCPLLTTKDSKLS
jgi:hypothetical protein